MYRTAVKQDRFVSTAIKSGSTFLLKSPSHFSNSSANSSSPAHSTGLSSSFIILGEGLSVLSTSPLSSCTLPHVSQLPSSLPVPLSIAIQRDTKLEMSSLFRETSYSPKGIESTGPVSCSVDTESLLFSCSAFRFAAKVFSE
jgi:hypothetical protein